MAEFLLRQNEEIEVYGMMRRSANPNFINTQNFKDHPRFKFVFGDLSDDVSIDKLVNDIKPDYFINFAANSFCWLLLGHARAGFETNTLGVLRCLESIKKFQPKCRFYSAGSSEEFGNVDYSPQDINQSNQAKKSIRSFKKAAARHLVKVYCESYICLLFMGFCSIMKEQKR